MFWVPLNKSEKSPLRSSKSMSGSTVVPGPPLNTSDTKVDVDWTSWIVHLQQIKKEIVTINVNELLGVILCTHVTKIHKSKAWKAKITDLKIVCVWDYIYTLPYRTDAWARNNLRKQAASSLSTTEMDAFRKRWVAPTNSIRCLAYTWGRWWRRRGTA